MTGRTRRKAMLTREQKNEKYKHISLEMETSTHFPVLIKFVQETMKEGKPIIELGSGMFSTPLLHWLCHDQRRVLITWERHLHYLEFANKFKTLLHQVRHVPKVEDEDLSHFKGNLGIVFIDHSPKKPRTRGDDALLFKDIADYVILHDAGMNGKEKYGYDQLYSQFKYRFDFTDVMPHTTVLSNFHNPDTLWRS